jgi:hypothetical protein
MPLSHNLSRFFGKDTKYNKVFILKYQLSEPLSLNVFV